MRRPFKFKPGDILECSAYASGIHYKTTYYLVVRYEVASPSPYKHPKIKRYKLAMVDCEGNNAFTLNRRLIDNVAKCPPTKYSMAKTVIWRKVGGYV